LNGPNGNLTNSGLLSGAVTLNGANGNLSNSGNLSGAVQLNGANSTFANFGTWNATGNSSFAGPSTVNNFGNGVINISGPAGITLGAASIFNNSGTINAVSLPSGSPTITATTFNNSGLINLATGTGTNQLTIVGNFVGMPGSTLNVSVGPANSRADQLLIQGNASGTTSVNVFNIANQFIRNPIPVVTVTGNSSATFSLANPPPFNGLFAFSINQTSPGDFTLSSSLGPGGLGSVPVAQAARTATQVTIDGVETELRLRRDKIQLCAIVASPYCQSGASAQGNRLAYSADDSAAGHAEIALGYQDENKTDRGLYMAVKAPPPPQPVAEAGPKPAVWVQAFDDWQRLNQSVAGQNDGTHQNTYGFQGGLDETWRNLFASGDALVLGLVGGGTKAIVHFDSAIAGANLSGPGFGGYWTYINGGFSMDGVVKNDWFHFTEDFLTTGGSSSARIQNFNVTANAQYKFAVLTNSFIEPTAGFSYTQTTFSDVPSTLDLVNGHTTRVQGGARFGTAWDYNGIHFEPTLLGLAYSDVQITGTPLQTLGVPVPTDEGKVRGEFNLTLNADFGSGFSGFAEGDVRFGDNLLGGAIKGGLRKQW
jgi:outer membrane autotransporter protein